MRFVLLVVVVASFPYLLAAQEVRSKEISLKRAVAEFNQREEKQFRTTSQPLLTEEELIGAIRRFPLSQPPVSDKPALNAVLSIAESEVIPKNAYLTVLRGTYTQDHYCDVFDIQLTLKTGQDSHLTIPIRQRTLSSRKIRPEEQREMDNKARRVRLSQIFETNPTSDK